MHLELLLFSLFFSRRPKGKGETNIEGKGGVVSRIQTKELLQLAQNKSLFLLPCSPGHELSVKRKTAHKNCQIRNKT